LPIKGSEQRGCGRRRNPIYTVIVMNKYYNSFPELNRLRKQFRQAKILYKFHKPDKTHYPGQTKKHFLLKYKNTNKNILKVMLFGLIIIEKILSFAMYIKNKKETAFN